MTAAWQPRTLGPIKLIFGRKCAGAGFVVVREDAWILRTLSGNLPLVHLVIPIVLVVGRHRDCKMRETRFRETRIALQGKVVLGNPPAVLNSPDKPGAQRVPPRFLCTCARQLVFGNTRQVTRQDTNLRKRQSRFPRPRVKVRGSVASRDSM
jgi:hypothetical protein